MVDCVSHGMDMLDEDIMGELLPLLTVDDMKNARLCCKGWQRAIQHRTRILHPFYLPLAAPEHPLSSLEVLQLPLVRPVQQHLLQLPLTLRESSFTHLAAPTAAAEAASATIHNLTSLAPLRGLSAAGVQGLGHASVLNLTGQQLPYNVLKLLCQHMTRLKALQLDYCKLPAPALLHATGLTSLQCLSLAGSQLQGGFHQHVKEAVAAAITAMANYADASAAAAAVVSAAAAAADDIEQAGPERQRAANVVTPAPGAMTAADAERAGKGFASAWVAEQQMHVVSNWQLQPAPSSLIGWSSGKLAVLTAAENGVLLDAVLLPQLQRFNLDKPARLLDLPELMPNPSGMMPHGLLLLHHASKLARLSCLGSLSLIGQKIDQQDWQALVAVGSRLTELHLSWNCAQPGFDTAAFAQLGSGFTRLQTLSLAMTALEYYGQLDDDVTLTGLAGSLKVLRLAVDKLHDGLLLSLTYCSKVTELELIGVHSPARDELLVQVVRSMPLLESLSLAAAGPPRQNEHTLRQPGDYLLSQLDLCCPKLTSLHMPGVAIDGRGIKLAAGAVAHTTATASAAAGGGDGAVGDAELHAGCGAVSGLRNIQRLELCVSLMMRSMLPQLSYLSSLRSIVLHSMPLREFPHVCRLNCLTPLSSLRHLTSLRILPVSAEQLSFMSLPAHAPGPAAAEQQPLLLQQLHQQQQQQQQQQVAMPHPQAVQQGNILGPQVALMQLQQLAFPLQQHQQHLGQLLHPQEQAAQQANLQQQLAELANVQQQQQAANVQQEVDAFMDDASSDVLPGSSEASDTETDSSGDDVGSEDVDSEVDGDMVDVADDGGGADMHAFPQQQQPGQQLEQQQPALQPWMKRLSFEPHLHFLAGLPGLVELELGCLQTNGICLLHLHSLPQLRSLTLGGNITLNDASWGFLAQLHLPGVTQLSLTGCRVVTRSPAVSSTAAARSAASGAASSSKAAAAAAAADSVTQTGGNSMDCLAGLLTTAFPSCRNLELGSCRTLSYNGLEALLLGLAQLRVLRLLGLKDFKLCDPLSNDSSSSSTGSRSGNGAAGAAAGMVVSVLQQVRDAVSRRSAGPHSEQQPYFVRLAERGKCQQHQRQQHSGVDVQPGSSAGAVVAAPASNCLGVPDPADSAAAESAPALLQLQYLEVCDDQAPGDCVPQSALLAARQQSSSSMSGQGLPALADLLGAWHGVPGPGRGGTLVFVNSGGSMVPLMK